MGEIIDIEKVTDDWECETDGCCLDADVKFTHEQSSVRKVDHYLCAAHAFLNWDIDVDKI